MENGWVLLPRTVQVRLLGPVPWMWFPENVKTRELRKKIKPSQRGCSPGREMARFHRRRWRKTFRISNAIRSRSRKCSIWQRKSWCPRKTAAQVPFHPLIPLRPWETVMRILLREPSLSRRRMCRIWMLSPLWTVLNHHKRLILHEFRRPLKRKYNDDYKLILK